MDACEQQRTATFEANTLLPQKIACVCLATNTPWGHVSSGCIYSGAKVFDNGAVRIVRDLNAPGVRELFDAQPERFFGFTNPRSRTSHFAGSLAASAAGPRPWLRRPCGISARCYVWRQRIPFGAKDEPANLLSKLRVIRGFMTT